MPIRLTEVPPQVAEEIESALVRLHEARLTLEPEASAPVAMTAAVPLHSAPSDQVAEGNWLSGARQFGWRSLLEFADGSVGYADVEQTGDRFDFARTSRGARATALVEAAAGLGDDIGLPDTELRIVEAPEVRLSAIWLAGEEDLFIPFQGLEGGLMGRARFLAESTEHARRYQQGLRQAQLEEEQDDGDDQPIQREDGI